MAEDDIEARAINVIRGFAMDAPRAANNGHSGTAMALAPLAHVLFTRIMQHDPAHADWPDRDRFVLSCGHASILLYSQLFLCGYGLELADLEAFRQWGSLTPGHPEVGHTRGVEVTTGPLGQGIADAVGLAMAERILRHRFGTGLQDHHTYVVAGDGDLQEGISHEAASLAGHLGLGRLVVIYDDNHITIDGSTALSSSDDAGARFAAYGWDVQHLGEMANDVEGLERAVRAAIEIDDKPSLLILRSHIGYPSPALTDTASAHGNPFPPDEIAKVKALLDLPADRSFYAPDDVVEWYRTAAASRAAARAGWLERFAALAPVDRAEWDAAWGSGHTAGWSEALPHVEVGGKPVATRVFIQTVINATATSVPGLVSGAADLTGNTGTVLQGAEVQSAASPGGRQVHYGIREHAMGAAMVGMALHGGVLPVGGTFFVFSDYMKPAVRLAALSGAKVVFVFTHDSVGIGADGPTHQPIEHLAALRAVPGLQLIRPADANETAAAWKAAVEHDGPTALVLSRQDLPVVTDGSAVDPGAGIVSDDDDPDVVLVATGSEVWVCLDAAAVLRAEGLAVRVVSLPSWDRFERQSAATQAAVLPPDVPTVSVEAASTFGWRRFAQANVGIDRFGASAPGDVVLRELGINPANVAAHARALLGR